MKRVIQIPEFCPSCNSKLEQINTQLFCRNISCPAQSTKKVEAFIKKMRIKGLGPSTISKLGFSSPLEIYETSQEEFVEILGEKIGNKIFDEVENSRDTTFATFLSALSIPLIGDTASKKIAEQVNNLDEMAHTFELNIGNKAQENLQDWQMTDAFVEALYLEEFLRYIKPNKKSESNKGSVCITGKLNDFSNRTKLKNI